MSFEESKKFDVFEVEVWEEDEDNSQNAIDQNDIHHNLSEAEKDQQALQTETVHQRRQRRVKRKAKVKEPKYNWAFFLASLFIGIGITATFGTPFGLFMGLGLGFLFFVDPIYEKIMQRLNDM